MGLPLSTSRRESGKVTENDIREYLAETRAMVSKRMSADELEDYMYEIEKRTRSENPITQSKKKPKRNRKKLPSKPKIDIGDSVVVLDKNENLNTVVPSEAKPQERQSFKSLAKAGALSLGSSVFNKMFPTLGKGLDVLKGRLEKQEKNTADNNVANKSYAQQVERSSVFLTNISDGQSRTNDLLQQILVAVNAGSRPLLAATQNPAPGPAPAPGGTQTSQAAQNRTSTAAGNSPASGGTQPKTQMNTGTAVATLAAGATVAGAGYAASNALGIGGGSAARAEPDESGTFRRSATGEANMQIDYSRSAGKHSINNREVDRETYSRFRQLSRGRDEDDPRYAQYVQEGRQGPDSFFAESNALQRVRQERNQELRVLVQRIERGEASPEAAAARQATAAQQTVSRSGSQTPADQSANRAVIAARPAMQNQTTTPGSPSVISPTTNPGGFNPRMLNIRAEEILFKADRFEYSQGSAVRVSSGGSTGSDGAPAGGGLTPNTITAPSGGGGGAAASQTGAPQLTSIRTKSGKNVQVAASVADRFRGFLNDLEGTGYQIRDIGGYANRPNVNNPSVMSVHASGMAIDINPAENPNRSTRTDMPPETAQIAAKWGLGWGMNWRSVKDPMHFSAAANEGGGAPQPEATQAATPSASPAASAGGEGAASPESGTGAPAANAPSAPAAIPAPASPSTGAAVSSASVADETASRPAPVPPPAPPDASAPLSVTPPSPSLPGIDPNNPGPVEPADAAIRYSRLFNIAA